MIPFKIFLSVFGVIIISSVAQNTDTRIPNEQIASATFQSDRHEVTIQPSHQQRPAAAASSYEDYNPTKTSYEDYNPTKIASSDSRKKTDQPRLIQHNSQREEKRYTTIFRNSQSGSSTESPRSSRPLSFQIGSQKQRPSRKRRPMRVRVRQYNQSKDEPREHSRPTFNRPTNRNNSPSTPTSYSFSNSNIYVRNANRDSSGHPETGSDARDIWKPTTRPKGYSSSTLITLSTPPTTPKIIASDKENNDEVNLEVQRMRLLFKRLEEQEKNRNPEDGDSSSRTGRYTSSYSKVTMAQNSEGAKPKYVRPPKGSTVILSTLRPVYSSTVKATTIKPIIKTTSDNPNSRNYSLSEDKLETSTLQPSASAPQSVNISAYAPTTESTAVIITTTIPVPVINITTDKSTKTTTVASVDSIKKEKTQFDILKNITIPDIYKNTPVSPARLATYGNFNLPGFGGSQQQQKHFQPKSSSLLGGFPSQGGLSNLFGIGSLPGLGGFGNYGSHLSDSTSHSTDTSAKNSGSNGGSFNGYHGSIDHGSDTSNYGGGSLFGGGVGGLSSLGITPSLYGASNTASTKSNGVGHLDYLSLLSSLGGLSGIGGLDSPGELGGLFGLGGQGGTGGISGGGLGTSSGFGGLFGLSGQGGAGGQSQQSTYSPSFSLSSLGLGGNFGSQNQSPAQSSSPNLLSGFPNFNLAGIGGLSGFPSLTGGSNIGKDTSNIPSLTSAAFPSLPAIPSSSSIGNIAASPKTVALNPISVSVETVKTT